MVDVSVANVKAGSGLLLKLGLNLTKNSAAKCCASAAEPPLPQSIIFPPVFKLDTIFFMAIPIFFEDFKRVFFASD